MAEKLNLAVFIDYDNIAIGVKNSINRNFNYEDVRRWLESKGEISSQVAYGNWSTYHDQDRIQRTLARYGVEVVNRASLPGGKNGADIALSLDALELVFTQEHINAFCILSGDSDFIPLVIKLKTHGKRVYVVGGTEFSNENLRRNCHEFISYESLCRQAPAASQAGGGEADREEPPRSLPIEEAVPVVREAIRKVRDRGLRTFTWNLKAELRKVGFDERAFGYEHFQELVFRLVDDGHFRKQPIGDKFYIAEIEGDTGPAEPPPERPAFVPGGAYRPVSALTDAERAVATIRQALASIDRAAKAATLDLLYETILDIDPRFPSYGCSHTDFKQFVARLVAQHHFKLEFKNGVCLVQDNAAGAGADSAPVEPVQDGREDWQRAMQRILRDNASLLRNGMPSKQLEVILAAKSGPDGTRPDPGMIRSFLRFAVREDLLAKEIGADDTVWYSLPPGQSAGPAPAPDPDVTAGPPRPGVADRGGERPVGSAESTVPEALSIVRAALRGNAELSGNGLQRSGLRAAVLAARPDFEVADYGLRSFRELLDRLCEQGFLEAKDSGDGLRYFGTDQLESADAPGERPSGAEGGGFLPTDRPERAPQPASVAAQPPEESEPGDVPPAPARVRAEEAPDTGDGDAGKEAVGIVRTALSGNAALAETGLPRRGLRAAILAARPDFDIRTYGLRSFRELVDRVCEAGYLEARNDPDDGALYFGTDLLASAAPAVKKSRRGAGRSRESAPDPNAPSAPRVPPVAKPPKKPMAALSEGPPGAASPAPAIGLKRFLARFGKKPGGAATN